MFAILHTKYKLKPQLAKGSAPQQEQNDSSISVPLNVDRIRCCSTIITNLLCTVTTRPVQVPSGLLIKYAIALVGASPDGQVEGFVDPVTRAMEISVVPSLWKYGCEIITTLAENIPHCLEPALSQLYTVLAHRLEQSLTQEQRASVLETLQQLLQASSFIDSVILPNRIMRAVLPSLTIVLSSSNAVDASAEDSKSNKGKKKAKNYTGDEVFKVSRDVICPTETDAKVLLSALQVVKYCLQNPNLSSSQSSLASRILLSIQLSLSQLSPSVLSPDPQVFCQVQQTVLAICTGMASTSTISLQRALPLLFNESLKTGDTELQSAFDLLIHPRLPPIVRPIPLTQSLTLFRVEESEEEAVARKLLRLEFGDESLPIPNPREQDTIMEDAVPPAPVPRVQQNGGGEAFRLPFLSNQPAVPQQPQPQPTVQSAAPKIWQNEQQQKQDFTPTVTQAAISPSEKQKLNSGQPRNNAAASSSSFLIPQSNSDAEDQDEEIPTIDMASDSEEEGDDE
ncbi:hypothetical protein EST38_g7991 [Candolleomyces aberdarensis]|uniref:Pre-rRNA-processing protein RIX1 n=1 Tax=Candolleomyces aberdarensis TaxID=2316362 RepID=A0A4Q2DFW5_9AGAR|nr:hypothetical protein EST38_g7991 [Candolleomyces aberdarensis]